MREEDYPEKQSYSKIGLLILLLIVILTMYTLLPLLFPDKVAVDDPEREYDIIVRFIGIYQQLLTNTNPFYYR